MTLHSQVLLTSASVSFELEANTTEFPDESYSFSDATPASSSVGYAVSSGGTQSVVSGDNAANSNSSSFSLRSAVTAEARGLGFFGWATSEANAGHSFTVSSAVHAVINYGSFNSGSQHGPYAGGGFDGDSNWTLSLTSSSGATLFQFGGSTPSLSPSGDNGTLDLGILQPGETYTLSGSTYATAIVQGFGTEETIGRQMVTGSRIASVSGTISMTAVPEPATYAFVAGMGLLSLGAVRWHRRTRS